MKAFISWGLLVLMVAAAGLLALRGCGVVFGGRLACPKCGARATLISFDENASWYECPGCGKEFSGPGQTDVLGEQAQDYFPER